MKKSFIFAWVFVGVLSAQPSLAAQDNGYQSNGVHRQKTTVTLEISARDYDYFQPWSRSVKEVQQSGVVLTGQRILTTARGLANHTLLRVQKHGRGQWWIGKLDWIDYHANLALISVPDTAFWDTLVPATLAGVIHPSDRLEIVRWREGHLETRVGDFNQFTVQEGDLSWVNHVQLELDSDMEAAGNAEPVYRGTELAGLMSEQKGKQCTVIPAAFIAPILRAQAAGDYRGLGYFHFVWQPAENPDSLEYLGLPGRPRGVIVIETSPLKGRESVLQPKDVLLEIDGFAIDIQGDYEDPDYGYLMLENLATRGKWAGDLFKLKIWREGKSMEVEYRLPKVDYAAKLVPDSGFDREPEYLIAGGLVFQPLTADYLAQGKHRLPFRLNYYRYQEPGDPHHALVLLSHVLPDPYNVGYQDHRFLVVDRVNHRRIDTLSDLHAAFEQPTHGFQFIEFVRGNTRQRIVLDAEGMEKTTQRVLQRYGIRQDHVIASRSEVK